MIGANRDAIHKGEDREAFQAAMERIGVRTAAGKMIGSLDEALAFVGQIGYPAIIRPSFTLGGTGGGVANDEAEFRRVVRQGLQDSPVHTVLVEESSCSQATHTSTVTPLRAASPERGRIWAS